VAGDVIITESWPLELGNGPGMFICFLTRRRYSSGLRLEYLFGPRV